jgi:endo-1,4-beta-xylanase
VTYRMSNGVTRRAAVLALASATLGAVASSTMPRPARADFDLELAPPLRTRSRTSGIKFGCAGAAPSVQTDRILLEKIAAEANIFVPEGSLKWDQTEPRPGEFNFSEADSVAAFAARNDMMVHGHTLVWYTAIPPWVAQLTTSKDAQAALERHIATEVSRYRGKIWAWDVVNEPIEPDDRLDNDYRNSVWLRCLGHDYVDLAFRLARAADPKTPLCLNEYGIEYATGAAQRKRQALLALLQTLRKRNTPIDCVGLQSHLDCRQTFDRDELTSFLKSVVDLGYRVMITELDVNDAKLRGNEMQRDLAVAQHVSEYLDIVFSVTKPISIATWGLSDRYTWLRQYYKRTDGTPLRPLPLDTNFDRKRMWASLARYVGT